MKRLLFDTESDGFVAQATKVHCIAAVDVDTLERLDWKPDAIDDAIAVLDQADVVIGHNIQRHDIPLLTKLKGWALRGGVVVRDTMVSARTIHPNVKDTDKALVFKGIMPAGRDYQGKHTIAAWGYRLGIHKGDYAATKRAEAIEHGITDEKEILKYVWGFWNEEMHEYMKQDVLTNLALWNHLDIDNYSQPAIELEHRVAILVDKMEKAGVPFDVAAAGKLHATLIGKKAAIEDVLRKTFGSWQAPISPDPKKALFTPKRDNKTLGYKKGVSFVKMKTIEFNPGSRDHIAKVLMDRGWKPLKFTEGGKPQIDDEVLEGVVQRYPEMDGLSEYLTLDKRLSQLADGKQAWLKHVGEDGLIHGVINPMGTTTSRASHFNPNLGQVPKAASPYGPECRSLFYAPPGWKLVGADASGLELRALAHYLHPIDGGKYSKIVCEGDVHWYHAQVMGLAEGDRDKHNKLHTIVREDGSKRFIYAYIYGCWDDKAGEIIYNALVNARRACGNDGVKLFVKFFGDNEPGEKVLRRVGKTVRDAFMYRIEGFGKLQHRIKHQVEQCGWVPGLDGRRVPIRSEHSALNFMIQSCGAILCKRWICDAFDELSAKYKHGWDGQFVFCLWVHDEVQVAVREGLEEEIGAILVKHARAAGEAYGFRVPLDSSYEAGRTWNDTH